MTDIMSYQYPPPPPNGAEMGMPSSGYIPAYESLPTSSDLDIRSEHGHSFSPRDRRDSFSNSMHLKRSMSTPSVRPQLPPHQSHLQEQPEDHASFLAGEKRRNKLGYHRTSVACGHCRRRKIRCIPSPDDPQGRCINCIRLKKDCTFFPVDQQPPPTDNRQKSGSHSSVGPGRAPSASSSPAMASGRSSDIHGGQQYRHQLSIQTMAPPSMKAAGADGFSPDGKLVANASTSRSFEYGHVVMTNWMSSDGSPSTSSSYPRESPVTPALSPYTPSTTTASAAWTTSGNDDPSSRDELPWSSYHAVPVRSMSFGSESLSNHPHHHQSYQYSPISQITSPARSYDRKLSSLSGDMYPGPIVTTGGTDSVPGTTLEHNISHHSAGAMPQSSYGSWHTSYSHGWYGENGGAQSLAHDEQGHHAADSQLHSVGIYYSSR